MALLPPPASLLLFLKRYPGYYIVAHEEPDGDSIGSQLAFASFLRRRGKQVILLSPGPWQRKEIAPYRSFFRDTLSKPDVDLHFGLVVLDCASLSRTAHFASILEGLDSAVIDHHQLNGMGQGIVQYIEPNSPSTTLLIQKVIESFGESPTPEEARYLFLGFATDTGFFRHLETEASESLELLSRLASKGITPKSIYRETFGNYSFESRRYLAKILSTMEPYFQGKLLLTHILHEEYQTFGSEHRQSDPLYQLLLSVEGCEAVAFLREEEPRKTSVSLRSPSTLNVAAIAQKLGGGGHKNAAGYITSLPYQEAKTELLEQFRWLFGMDP
ncbi:MAG: bifunctional oligoribonuclease/PAP phosphatase NrnA [Spirochaetes bacterium]|nr:bifunctional oligoribonuclease/PAP phosphatase NrnA [Spirochaetota bacterium]